MEEICKLLGTVAIAFAKVFVVIDALDECEKKDRKTLISSIRKLPSNIFFLSTSRKIPDLENMFEAALQLKVNAADVDIRAYIDGQIKSTSDLGHLLQKDSRLKEELLTKVVSMSTGM